jgi:(p)ppGpp synthase/HD superfamily hydrolase
MSIVMPPDPALLSASFKAAAILDSRGAAVAARLHAGQIDKAGAPYIDHLRRVAVRLMLFWPSSSATAIEAAWLHDSLEDTNTTPELLITAGIASEAVAIVKELTRPPTASYAAYIAALASWGSIDAVRIKRCDNADNSDPDRLALLCLQDRRRLTEKYERAATLLNERLQHDRP